MSDYDETREGNRLDEFLEALSRLAERYADLDKDVDVLVDVRETSRLAATSERVRTATEEAVAEEAEPARLDAAARGRPCNPLDPRCPPGSKCVLRATSLRWRCFP